MQNKIQSCRSISTEQLYETPINIVAVHKNSGEIVQSESFQTSHKVKVLTFLLVQLCSRTRIRKRQKGADSFPDFLFLLHEKFLLFFFMVLETPFCKIVHALLSIEASK